MGEGTAQRKIRGCLEGRRIENSRNDCLTRPSSYRDSLSTTVPSDVYKVFMVLGVIEVDTWVDLFLKLSF